MQKISFTSRIKPVSSDRFGEIMTQIGIKNAIKYPWTIQDSILAKDVFTRNIYDCSGCFITDGNTVLGMHLCPETSKNNSSINFIRDFINNKLDLNSKNLQALVIGSQNQNSSQSIYNNLISILKEYHIPTTTLKTPKTDTHIAYKCFNDEFYITSTEIDKDLLKTNNFTDCINQNFEEVSISPLDEIAN